MTKKGHGLGVREPVGSLCARSCTNALRVHPKVAGMTSRNVTWVPQGLGQNEMVQAHKNLTRLARDLVLMSNYTQLDRTRNESWVCSVVTSIGYGWVYIHHTILEP